MSLTANPFQTTVQLSSTRVLGPSQHRKTIVLSCPPTNRITIQFGAPAVLDAGFLTLYPAGKPVILDYEYIGPLIFDDMFAITVVGTQTLTGCETLYYP